MKTIAIANQKGGVGKTTTAINLGAALTKLGKRVLLVDNDPQADLTAYLGCKEELTASMATIFEKAIRGKPPVPQEGLRHHAEGMDFIPSDIGLAEMELILPGAFARESILRKYLKQYQDKYDYCLIDTMPSLGVLSTNSLTAADSVLVPVVPQLLPLKGLLAFMSSVAAVRNNELNPNLQVEGFLITMSDARTLLSREVTEALHASYGQQVKVFKESIPTCTRTAAGVSSGHSAFVTDPDGKATLAYMELAKEVAKNERTQKKLRSERNAAFVR